MNQLRDVVLSTGSTEPYKWTERDRRRLAISVYAEDEKQKDPAWMYDALMELGGNQFQRMRIIDALEHDSAALRHMALGAIIEQALLGFPLDSLAQTAAEHEAEWIAEDHQQALRNEAQP